MKFLGEYYWYVQMPWCGYVEHGLEYFSFYVAHLAACSGPPDDSRYFHVAFRTFLSGPVKSWLWIYIDNLSLLQSPLLSTMISLIHKLRTK